MPGWKDVRLPRDRILEEINASLQSEQEHRILKEISDRLQAEQEHQIPKDISAKLQTEIPEGIKARLQTELEHRTREGINARLRAESESHTSNRQFMGDKNKLSPSTCKYLFLFLFSSSTLTLVTFGMQSTGLSSTLHSANDPSIGQQYRKACPWHSM